MVRKTIVGKYCTKEQETLFFDMTAAILKYSKAKFGVDICGPGETVLFDDVKMMNSSKGNGWIKMEFYFKVVK